MFRRRSSGSLSEALRRSRDPELAELDSQVSHRQEQVAELELELFEMRAELATFQAEMGRRLGPLQTRLSDLRTEVTQARHRAARRAQWGERAESEDDAPPDVFAQYERTWRKTPEGVPREPKPAPDAATKREIKAEYRALAKRFHPDLTGDLDEKKWREKVMAEVNQAYADGNLAELRKLANRADRPERGPQKSREQILVELRKEIKRLDTVVAQLQAEVGRLTRSAEVKLMLDASIARREGRDLLAEMAADLRREIVELELELAELE
ncbi:MAG: J domain-containing protein [Anaerolineales bacterium]